MQVLYIYFLSSQPQYPRSTVPRGNLINLSCPVDTQEGSHCTCMKIGDSY